MANKAVVITTIQQPTPGVQAISKLLGETYNIVIIGDKKSPPDYSAKNVRFYTIDEQHSAGFHLGTILPCNHYARKNIGYLIAIKNGAELILETDDDNIPYQTFGQGLNKDVDGELITAEGWFNVYREFTAENIWPRGFPLERINQEITVERESCTQRVHIQQYLADKHPDVDAVFRLSQPYGEIQFNQRKPVILNRGTFCPFNSQNTVTFEAAFPLLYLPSYVSFRMTDIWRSFISQAIIWSQGSFVSFHSSTVFQERNVHDLLHDFELEIPGYLENQRIVDILSSIHFSGSVGDRLYQAYDRLRKEDIIQEEELKLVENWLKDLEEC